MLATRILGAGCFIPDRIILTSASSRPSRADGGEGGPEDGDPGAPLPVDFDEEVGRAIVPNGD